VEDIAKRVTLSRALREMALAVRLTETNLLVVSDTRCGLLGQEFFGVKEHTGLLLESSLSLKGKVEYCESSPEYLPS